MKQDCPYCKIVHSDTPKLYEDDTCVAVLSPTPCTVGHVVVIPKQHYPIVEMVPDLTMSHLGGVINKISVAVFESLNAAGINIMICNGVSAGQRVAHLGVDIIPRHENDNLDLAWQPKQLSEEELSTVELKLKSEAEAVGGFQTEKREQIVMRGEPEPIRKKAEDYALKQLNRLP